MSKKTARRIGYFFIVVVIIAILAGCTGGKGDGGKTPDSKITSTIIHIGETITNAQGDISLLADASITAAHTVISLPPGGGIGVNGLRDSVIQVEGKFKYTSKDSKVNKEADAAHFRDTIYVKMVATGGRVTIIATYSVICLTEQMMQQWYEKHEPIIVPEGFTILPGEGSLVTCDSSVIETS